jgi:hypothetical protein
MTDREERIRQRAEELWREAGQPQGRDEEFWHKAEKEIDADPSPEV